MRRTRMATHLAPLLLATLAACSSGDALVVVSVSAQSPIANIMQLNVTSTAAHNVGALKQLSLGAPFTIPPEVTFAVDVPAAYAGEFDVNVEAFDVHEVSLGSGHASGTTTAGARSDLSVTLGGTPIDASAPSDLVAPIDAIAPVDAIAQIDMVRPADLTAATPVDAARDTSTTSDLVAIADLAHPDLAALPPDMASSCPAGVVLCDDFEAGMIDFNRWSTNDQNAKTSIDSVHAHRGSSALHISTSATTPPTSIFGGVIQHMPISTSPAPTMLWERGWYFIPAPTAFGTIIGLNTTVATNNFQVVLGNGTNDYLGLFDYYTAASIQMSMGAISKQGNAAVPRGSWFCVEVSYAIVGTTNPTLSTHVYISPNADGSSEAEVSDLAFTGYPLGAGAKFFTSAFGFGDIKSLVAHDAYDFWVDDVIVDTSPIGCTK